MAKPAVREMGVSDARANMTEVIAEVRLLETPVVLTRRDKPQVVLVPVAWYERESSRELVLKAAMQVLGELPEGQRTPAQRRLGELIFEATSD